MKKLIGKVLTLSALLCCAGVLQANAADGKLHVDGYTVYGSLNANEQAGSGALDGAEDKIKSAVGIGTSFVVPKLVNNTGSVKTVTVAAAVYGEDGSLTRLSGYNTLEIPTDEAVYPRVPVLVEEEDKGNDVKVFVWEDEMTPVKSVTGRVFTAVAGAEEYEEVNPELISIPSLFSDNMVVQRDKNINLWGRVDSSIKQNTIRSFLLDPLTGAKLVNSEAETAPSGNSSEWTVSLGAHAYDGVSYELIIEAEDDGKVKSRVVLDNVVIGDVYLCSGQSNMEYEMLYNGWTDCHNDLYSYYERAKDENGNEIRDSKGSITPVNQIYSTKLDNSNVRIIENMNSSDIEEYYSTDTDGWHKAEAKTLEHFSATATYFGFELEEKIGIPVGLIQSAVGGSGIENWAISDTKDSEGNVLFDNNHGLLFRRQISAYTKGPVGLSGILWYQGCADADGTKTDKSGNLLTMSTYVKTMEQMVNDWREKFNQPELPFMYVQLASFTGNDFTAMREAQLNYRIGKNTNNGVPENVGMAVIIDNADGITDIHPRNKKEVGRRLSLLAQKYVYNEKIVAEGPLFKEAVVDPEKGTITVRFDEETIGSGLVIDGDKLSGMKISTAARRTWVEPEYELSADKKSIILKAPEGSLATYPSVVQYAYYQAPTDANLKNSEGLPASPFRNYDNDTPTVPDPIIASGLEAENISPDSVTLKWGADAEAAEAAYYEVVRNGEVIATVGSVPVTDKTVIAGEEYSYQLKLYNADGKLLDESAVKAVSVPEDKVYSVSVNDAAVSEEGIALTSSVNTTNAPLDGTKTIALPSKGEMGIDIPETLKSTLENGANLIYTYNAETVEQKINVTDGDGNVILGDFIGANGSNVTYWKKVVVPVKDIKFDSANGKPELIISNQSSRTVYIKEIALTPVYGNETAKIKASESENNTIELGYTTWFQKPEVTVSRLKGVNAITWNSKNWLMFWINPEYITNESAVSATFATTYFDTDENDTAQITTDAIGILTPVTGKTGEWITNVIHKDDFQNPSVANPAAYNDSKIQITDRSYGASASEIEFINGYKSIPSEIEMLGGTVHRTMMDYDRTAGAEIIVNPATGNAKYLSIPGDGKLKMNIDGASIPKTDNSVTIDITYISKSDAKLVYTGTNGTDHEIKLDAGGSEETPAVKTVHIKDYVNDGGITVVSSGEEFDLVRIRVTNDMDAYSEIVPDAAVDITPMPEAKLEISKDTEVTAEDAIPLKWSEVNGAEYYVVERSLGGVTEFVSGKVTETAYVDNGTANRPDGGPDEIDYEQRVSSGNQNYAVCEQSHSNEPLTGAGDTTKVYEPYEGMPIVSGGTYQYKVTAYAADGTVMAISDTTNITADKKENTASVIFSGTPSTIVNGYGLTIVNLPDANIENGEKAGASCWVIKSDSDEIGFRLNDDSGLINPPEKKNYLVKYTYLDNYPQRWTALKLARSTSSDFIAMLSGNKAPDKWVTREFVYIGQNNHQLTSGGKSVDMVIKGHFAGTNPGLAIRSIEITMLDEPVIEKYDIEVSRDDETTTDGQIGLKWEYVGENDEEVKYYRVERVSNGTVEFTTDGEVSDTKYIDKGTAQRPAYGPYEIDYEMQINAGIYDISDLGNNKQRLSDAGTTTRIYEPYEGVPLVSGGEYGYIVKGYNASGEVVAQSALTKLKTLERENTASLVFEGTPKRGFAGYNMSVSTVTNMEVGTYNGITGWTFLKDCDLNNSNLGLLFDDESGLINGDDDTGYLIKFTWGDAFWNANGTARINLQRTANPQYNQNNFNDWKNYISMPAGSGAQNNKWLTTEVAYYGRNAHSLTVDDVISDIIINANYAGRYGRFFIKSIEVTKWDGPEERPFEINMPSMFTDNMILQRDNEINVWGRIDGVPSEADGYSDATVAAMLLDQNGAEIARGTATASGTRYADWTLTLDDTVEYKEGKSYRLEITAEAAGKKSETVTFNNIIFGDVYLCAGQSNMRYGPEYKNWTDYNADLDNREFDNENIRIISNENATVSDYWETSTAGWRKANTETIRELSFSATAAYFGKHLYADNGNIPIGLISSAVGGASIRTFYVNPVTDSDGAQLDTGNSILYNRLIYPYTNGFNEGKGMSLAGIIWYQGEADAQWPDLSVYTKAMEQMVNDYRRVFNNDELPFMYAQLAAFDNPSGEYEAIREAQFNYMIGKNTNNGKPQNVGMVVITDNTDNIADIHPRNKSEVGRRLSLWARKLVYNQEDVEYTGPIFKSAESVEVEGANALTVTFEECSVMNGLKLRDGKLVGMKIAGEDKNFVEPDSYVISADQKRITVMSSEVSDPKYVQYGFYKLPTDASLFNADGLPASPFRNYD